MDSRFAMSDLVTVVAHDTTANYYELGRQNLTALCTTAGKYLAAVGSCHSLAETMNLGTMTLGGLIGTLHKYTSYIFLFLCSTA